MRSAALTPLFLALCFLMLVFPGTGFSQVVGGFQVATVDEQLASFSDSLLQLDYEAHPEEVLLLSSHSGTYIIQFELQNSGNDSMVSLHINQPLLDRADLFMATPDGYQKVLTFGESIPYSTREYESVTGIYTFKAGVWADTKFLLLAQVTENMRVPIFVGPKHHVTNEIWNKNYFFGLFAGILLVMFLYNFFVAFSTRAKSYYWYSAYLLFVLLTQASLQGYSHKYLWPEFGWLATRASVFFPAITGVAGIYFMIEFLQLRTKKPRFAKLAIFYVMGYSISVLVSVLGYKIVGYNLVSLVAGTQSFHMLVVAINLVLAGDRASKFFLIAWSAFLIGLLLFLIKDVGLLPYNWFTAYSMPMGVVIETVLLSFALADTINKLKEENEKSKLRELKLSQEKTAILSHQNEKLEQEVASRTQDIRDQNKVLEIKNKEVMDSIFYAKRLQKAILPSADLFETFFKESFLFYKPKDIVSGDFYWSKSLEDDLYVVIADCTGHGVPGAMVSVVGITGLERCLTEYHLRETDEILDKLSDLVSETFEDENIQDGMDLGIVKWNRKSNEITFSGANSSLWLFSKNEFEDFPRFDAESLKMESDYTCYRVMGSRQPIGKYYKKKPFNKTPLTLEAGDKIYMLTDGLLDQFGGSKGKKFRTINFIKLAYSLIGSNMKEQQASFVQRFNEWSGNQEQVDDVTVFGAEF